MGFVSIILLISIPLVAMLWLVAGIAVVLSPSAGSKPPRLPRQKEEMLALKAVAFDKKGKPKKALEIKRTLVYHDQGSGWKDDDFVKFWWDAYIFPRYAHHFETKEEPVNFDLRTRYAREAMEPFDKDKLEKLYDRPW